MADITKNGFLEAFPTFRRGPAGLVESILSSTSRFVFPKDRQIFNRGDICKGIAFVLSGEIRVFKTGDGGREITLYDIQRGETCILNAACILSDIPYPANAVTTEEGEALLMPAGEFQQFVDRFPDMRRFVFERLGERLIAVTDLVEEVVFRRLDERLKDYIVEKSEDGVLSTTHLKIASDLGTSREVISRVLEDLQKRGHITLSRNQIRIIDLSIEDR